VEVPRDLRGGIGSQPQYQLSRPTLDAVLCLVHFTQELGNNSWQAHTETSQQLTILLLLLLHPFNSLFSRTTWVSRHQKGKLFWVLLEQEVMGWQWHQLDHMQIICTSHKTDNHASTSPLSFYRPDALPAAQPTASKHWMQITIIDNIVWKYHSPLCTLSTVSQARKSGN